MGERCLPEELRTLFLFARCPTNSSRRCATTATSAPYEPGPICIEGEPATCFYVLIEGELVMSKRSGGDDIETNRTSARGAAAPGRHSIPTRNTSMRPRSG